MRATVRNNRFGKTVEAENFAYKESGGFFTSDRLVAGNIMCLLREAVLDNEDGVKTFGNRKVSHEIKGNIMPPVGRHREWLQKPIGLMAVGFRTGTSITAFDVFADTAAKTRPKIIAGNELVRFRDTIMTSSWGIVAALEDVKLQLESRDVEEAIVKK